jgi:hypothetical protein
MRGRWITPLDTRKQRRLSAFSLLRLMRALQLD